MTKFKSQNEVDMEDFNDNKPSQKWLDWFRDTFDLSEDGKVYFWIDVIGISVFTLVFVVLIAYVVWLMT